MLCTSAIRGGHDGARIAPLTTRSEVVHDKSMTLSYTGTRKERMPTIRKAVTPFMPPEKAEQVQQVLKEEGRTIREFLG